MKQLKIKKKVKNMSEQQYYNLMCHLAEAAKPDDGPELTVNVSFTVEYFSEEVDFGNV